MKDNILKELPGVQKNILLKNYTTYKIGGFAKYFFVAKNKESLAKALEFAKRNKLPVFVFGGGSNLLVSDKGFKGLVIKIDISGIELNGKKVIAGAGVGLAQLANLLAEKGLSGLEWAAGIPAATIGGAIFGHAQAFGIKISDSVKEVTALDVKSLKIKRFTKNQCLFSLKSSIFKKTKRFVIISAVLEFSQQDTEEIKKLVEEFKSYRKNCHPINFPSAGSTFINPATKIKDEKLLIKFPELREYNRRGVIPAGFLLAKCGLSGKKIGDAQISEKHANFILNLGQAKARDVLALINLAQKAVKKTFKINLQKEVQLVGF
jgi:UDP-N-acetylmuramate dehydrogenase